MPTGYPSTINRVTDCARRIMGEVIRVRWLLNEGNTIGKAASSVVVYLQNEVFLGPEACMKMAGEKALCGRVPMEGPIPRLRFLCGGVLL